MLCISIMACSRSDNPSPVPGPAGPFSYVASTVDNSASSLAFQYTSITPVIRFTFSAPVSQGTVAANFLVNEATGTSVPFSISYQQNDSVVVIQPSAPLKYLTRYTVRAFPDLQSKEGRKLGSTITLNLLTKIDSARKFPTISDDELLTKVQQQTFKYFWDFAHPTSFLARERSNGDNNVVTSGGSGFGIMALVVGAERGFVTRAAALSRLQTMVSFLKNNAVKVKGAFPHWLNGATGAIVPFSAQDNGADLVETSFLIQGLLTARQYFDRADAAEVALRNDINDIWNAVDWDWFRRGGQNTLYWHYSDSYQWAMNLPVRGWNECLITYVLAASANTNPIPKAVYDNGWAGNGSIRNGAVYFGHVLPLGPERGGPLFFEHYSFLGLNPNGLADAYADYATQAKNHTLINYQYCRSNPLNGYSDSVWGLTASDIPNGYTASSPTNDVGVIAPTAALSSFPYTPAESMAALRFYYYVLGDKLWKEYGFIDAFSLKDPWFAGSFLAIDQGPIIVMIENYRTGLLWNLFTSCPEIKRGLRNLGFTAPYL